MTLESVVLYKEYVDDKNLVLPPSDIPVFLNDTTKSKLESWEDFVSYYQQLEEGTNAFSWIKADVLLHLWNKFGEGSLHKFARDLNVPNSTFINYVRVAKAFPPDKREPLASFTAHFQASFADSYDDKNQKFLTDTRFGWVETAASDNLSITQLVEKIHGDKKKRELDVETLPCDYCKQTEGIVRRFLIRFQDLRHRWLTDSLFLHLECYTDVIYLIKDGKKTS